MTARNVPPLENTNVGTHKNSVPFGLSGFSQSSRAGSWDRVSGTTIGRLFHRAWRLRTGRGLCDGEVGVNVLEGVHADSASLRGRWGRSCRLLFDGEGEGDGGSGDRAAWLASAHASSLDFGLDGGQRTT